jgi:hypothetical protein
MSGKATACKYCVVHCGLRENGDCCSKCNHGDAKVTTTNDSDETPRFAIGDTVKVYGEVIDVNEPESFRIAFPNHSIINFDVADLYDDDRPDRPLKEGETVLVNANSSHEYILVKIIALGDDNAMMYGIVWRRYGGERPELFPISQLTRAARRNG